MIKVISRLLPQDYFCLALSGGIDSIAIAHFLKRGKKKFTAVHVNAKYIDQDDIAEEKVREFCDVYDIPLVVKVVTDTYKKGSVEAWCRDMRYRMFQNVCTAMEIQNVVVCHHLDDCVESYLMNCFNGTSEYLPIPYKTNYNNMCIVRPFLRTTKDDINQYVIKKNLSTYVTEDELNADINLNRNWIRQCLRPIIELKYPGISKIVSKINEKFYQEYY